MTRPMKRNKPRTVRRRKVRTVKAWAVLDKGKIAGPELKKSIAQSWCKMLKVYFNEARVIPITITYTLPRKVNGND